MENAEPLRFSSGHRLDFVIENDATGFVVCDRDAKESLSRGEDTNRMRNLAEAGQFLVFELYQDDYLSLRCVNGKLRKAEGGWISKVSAKLVAKSGVVRISAGIEYLFGDELPDSYFVEVAVEPGDYCVSIYSYLNGINGPQSLGGESFADFFRRTRPDEEFPAWLKNLCYSHSSIYDPANTGLWDSETEYEKVEAELEEKPLVDFLIQFEPWKDQPVSPLDKDGWIIELESRILDRFPDAIPSQKPIRRDLLRKEKPPPPEKTVKPPLGPEVFRGEKRRFHKIDFSEWFAEEEQQRDLVIIDEVLLELKFHPCNDVYFDRSEDYLYRSYVNEEGTVLGQVATELAGFKGKLELEFHSVTESEWLILSSFHRALRFEKIKIEKLCPEPVLSLDYDRESIGKLIAFHLEERNEHGTFEPVFEPTPECFSRHIDGMISKMANPW